MSKIKPTSASLHLTTGDCTKIDHRRDENRRKVHTFMFIRVLAKYLERADPAMHTRVMDALRDCVERNEAGDSMYSEHGGLTNAIRERLRATVGDVHWRRAGAHFRRLLTKRRAEKVEKIREFRSFVDILGRALKETDRAAYNRAKVVLGDCEGWKDVDAAYPALGRVRTRLRQAVGEAHWRKAEVFSGLIAEGKPNRVAGAA